MLERNKFGLIYVSFTVLFMSGSFYFGDSWSVGLMVSNALLFTVFLPGYLASKILFPQEIDVVERIAFSLGLGVVNIPIIAYYLNQAGMLLTNPVLVGITVGVNGLLYLIKRRNNESL